MADQNAIGNIQLNKANNLSDLASKTAAARNLPVMFTAVIDTTNYTHPSGTTNNIVMASLLIPANSLGANDSMVLDALVTKGVTIGSGIYRWYMDTSAGVPGNVVAGTATQIAQAPSFGTTSQYSRIQRTIIAQGATNAQIGFNATAAVNTDVNTVANAAAAHAFDMTVDQYFIVAVTLGNIADVCTFRWAQVSINKSP